MYGWFATAFGTVALITSGAQMLSVEDDVPVNGGVEESVAFSVKVVLPTAVGVPATAPVEALRVSPAGSEPDRTLQVIGATAPVAETEAL